jgi:hypothetical protein
MTRRRKVLTVLLLIPVLAAAVWLGWLAYCNWRVERLISHFAKAPDQATADQLCRLLDAQSVSEDVGSRILELLTRPTARVRDPYPAGGDCLWITHVPPCSLAFAKMTLVPSFEVTTSSQEGVLLASSAFLPRSAQKSGNRVDYAVRMASRVDGRAPLDTAGVQSVTEHWDVVLIPRSDGTARRPPPSVPPVAGRPSPRWVSWLKGLFRPILDAPPGQHARNYSCTYTNEFQVRIAPPDQCGSVELRRDSVLDESMKAAFRPWPLGEVSVSGGRTVRWKKSIVCAPLDENVAFRGSFRPAVGATIYILGPGFALRRQYSGSITMDLASLPPGTYKGTVALTPDPVAALRLVDVKQIWGGSVEMPVEFEVVEPGTPGTPAPQAVPGDMAHSRGRLCHIHGTVQRPTSTCDKGLRQRNSNCDTLSRPSVINL